MVNSNSSPTIANVTFRHNGSQLGCSALQNINSSPVITNVTFQDNWTEGSSTIPPMGSAMCNQSSSPTMTHVTFTNNWVVLGGNFYGAALYNDSSNPVLENVTFINNGNVSIFIQNGSPSLTNVTLLNLTDNTIGIVIVGGSPILTNVTIWQGFSKALNVNGSANPTLRNTIIMGTCILTSGGITDDGGNLGSSASCGIPTSAALTLGSLADNGGSTLTIPLLSGSAAIGAGNATYCPATDQRGQPRFETCDSGAYEYNPQPFVTTRPASAVNTSGATLHAFVNANSFSTTASFEYGLTDSYGLTAAASPASLSGTGDTPVSAGVSGLVPGMTYHFRIVGSNTHGTDYGDDQVFTTTALAITYADPDGNCAGHTPCYASLQTAIDATPVNGEVRVYGNTYTESVTLNRTLIVTCVEAPITLDGLSLSSGTFVAPNGVLMLNGNLTHSGGAFDANLGSVTFIGSNITRTLTASVPTQFHNLSVSPSVTLILSTNNDNVGVDGTLTNDGVLRKSFGLSGVSLDFITLGSLRELTVDRVDQNHPQAAEPLKTGQYWSFQPNTGASGFNVNMTLPVNFVPDDKDKVCRYTGTDQVWDCVMTGFDAAFQTITRAGVTAFSDWAAGNNAAPTNVTLRAFSALSSSPLSVAGMVGALVLLALGIVLFRKRKRSML